MLGSTAVRRTILSCAGPRAVPEQETVLSSTRTFARAGSLGLAATLLTFALIVVGSVVRTTGSGLACPDWPLCQGRLIPPFQFNVMIEWTHRLLALLVSLVLLGIASWTLPRGA